ncbi:MAG TPA: hypothetical protein VFQ13_00655 [Anaerolineales bacterium]|nr:hypothetical protein [Anaerolineales bacterium]
MSIVPEKDTRTTKSIELLLVLSWLAGSIGAYFLTSFFSNFYPLPYQFVLLSLLFQWLCGTAIFLFSNEPTSKSPPKQHTEPLATLTLFVAFALSVAAVVISWQFPGLFNRRILFMELPRLPLFILLLSISLGAFILLFKFTRLNVFFERFKQPRFFNFTQVNVPGILLAMFFLFTYLIFAETINFPGFRTLDQFFDTDISEWLDRLTSTTLEDASIVRAVHPAVLLFLRPLVWMISILLNGDRLQAVLLLNALAGASCVMLTWLIVKRASGNTTYSLIFASLLGASASHLLLSSMLETYIYSALALLLFVFLIQNGHTSLKFTVPAGVLVFGITITNLIQTCILYVFNYPRLKVIIKYVLMVLLITAALNLLQVWIYPNARSVFQPSNFEREGYYIWDPFDLSWQTLGRYSLIARAVPLYGVVAPTPFVLREELAVEYPNFRTYQILLGEFHVAPYRGLADVTVKVWIVILAVAGILFILNLFKDPKQVMLPLSLALCLGFSLVLHMVYGDDPMLYSPNWVYALILFVALMLQRWADRRWLQVFLMAFLVLLINTNLKLIYQIMDVSLPYFGK